jgi:hypothetical protein
LPEVGPFTPVEWEAWLEAHHETANEAWLVSWKKSTGKQELGRVKSDWTARNAALAERLIAEGRMRPAGLRAYSSRR